MRPDAMQERSNGQLDRGASGGYSLKSYQPDSDVPSLSLMARYFPNDKEGWR